MFVFRFLGREAEEVETILDALPNLEQYVMTISSVKSNKNNRKLFLFPFSFNYSTILPHDRYIYCSSAGVYLKSDLFPHCEVS